MPTGDADYFIVERVGLTQPLRKIPARDVVALVPLRNGIATYVGGVLTRIDYDDSRFKELTYTNGNVTQIDVFDGVETYRKTLSYDASSNWLTTVEGYL